MAGFSVPSSAAFEDWLYFRREAARSNYLDGLSRLAGYYERIGNYQQTEEYARKQLELDVWRESAHRELMRALALRGERQAALQQYRNCCRALKEEMGIEPEERTTALFSEIREGKWPTKQMLLQSRPLPSHIDEDVADVLEVESSRGLIESADLGTLLAMVFVAWADGSLAKKEIRLIRQISEQKKLDDQELDTLMGAIFSPPPLEVIVSHLATPGARRRAAVAAYVLALIDHNLTFQELDAFDDLCEALEVPRAEKEEIRSLSYHDVRSKPAS